MIFRADSWVVKTLMLLSHPVRIQPFNIEAARVGYDDLRSSYDDLRSSYDATTYVRVFWSY
jgi:hypothetical protein